ncbi:MAG: hypothetical protein HY888_08385 [Deltaproteobacteria bacterium]|nr:hypothetical protein [Deltaproteobacteria bacterium]
MQRIILIAIILLALPCQPLFAAEGSGTFRAKWWNYYQRGLDKIEGGQWQEAVNELTQANSMRDKDQRMARTYGMNFIDYFPHRELGIAYLSLGRQEEAIRELEKSIEQKKSAKAYHYLDKARKALLKRQGAAMSPPAITLTSLKPEQTLGSNRIRVAGRVNGEGYVTCVTINKREIELDLAAREVLFDQEIVLGDDENIINIEAEDLMGKKARSTAKVIVDIEGPLISVAELVEVVREGKRFIRIAGEASDKSGVQSVVINGKELYAANAGSFDFDISIDKARTLAGITITATDSLGNQTSADMNVARELAAFARKPERILVASALPRIFSSDREKPVITLKESGELPELFVDRYYIEGSVSDNERVDRITINNSEIPVKKGKKVFFSRMVQLLEGSNKISISAADSAGNRAETDLLIRRKVPAVLQAGSRMSVTVLPFNGKLKNAEYLDIADDYLMGALVDQKRFQVIEREKLKQLLAEQKLSKEKLTDPSHSVRIGKLIAADAILATTVQESRTSLEFITRVISTETSEVMDVKDVFVETGSPNTIRDIMAGLATRIARGFPLLEGIVLKSDQGEILTDLGSAAAIHKGTGFIVFRKGPDIKHPVTGKSLGSETIKLAEGHLDEIQSGFSRGKLNDKVKKQPIKAADLIITK